MNSVKRQPLVSRTTTNTVTDFREEYCTTGSTTVEQPPPEKYLVLVHSTTC
jgi:hypothetical protein